MKFIKFSSRGFSQIRVKKRMLTFIYASLSFTLSEVPSFVKGKNPFIAKLRMFILPYWMVHGVFEQI